MKTTRIAKSFCPVIWVSSLIPLADIPFNRSKSDVKFLESAGCGAAVLASEFVYSNSVKNGETGILFSNADEFANGLTELVRSQELTERLSRNAQRYVSENRLIEQHVERWEEIYLSWVSNRDKLLRNFTKIHSYCPF
ncbi:glycosyltransferase [candidate division KSB1 bacterium]|nr:glycosyltransferase [candidate division KSB1 bacterium]